MAFSTNFQIDASRFQLKTKSKVVKIDQNNKILKIEKKLHFFDTLTTFVAQKLDSPAQIADWGYFGFLNFLVSFFPGNRAMGFKIHAQFIHLLKGDFLLPFDFQDMPLAQEKSTPESRC